MEDSGLGGRDSTDCQAPIQYTVRARSGVLKKYVRLSSLTRAQIKQSAWFARERHVERLSFVLRPQVRPSQPERLTSLPT